MNKTLIMCAGCGKAIDPAKGSLAFVPFSGALSFTATAADGGKKCVLIQRRIDFCGAECLVAYVKPHIREAVLAQDVPGLNGVNQTAAPAPEVKPS